MHHFPLYFQICDISKRQTALLWSKGLKLRMGVTDL